MSVRVRPARIEDAEAAGRVGYAAWVKGIQPIVPPASRWRISEANFEAFVRDKAEQVMIAEFDGTVAGLGGTEHGENHISDIWVSPEHEGRGIGTALVRALEQRILARGFGRASISVLNANKRALSLYRHLGYVKVSQALVYDVALDCEVLQTRLEKDLVTDN